MRRVILLLVVALTLAGCSSTITGSAQPDPAAAATTTTTAPTIATTPSATPISEKIFLEIIKKEGIGSGDDQRELARARDVCNQFSQGRTFDQVLQALVADSFTIEDAGYFTGAAVYTFCPEHLSKTTR